MGQYYKTSKPTFVDDFMYKPPYELYKEVIQSKDKQIDEGLASTADLNKYLNFNSLEFDQQEAENEKLKKDFAGIAKSYNHLLNENGLSVTDNGTIAVDRDAIISAADNGTLGDIFSGLNAF